MVKRVATFPFINLAIPNRFATALLLSQILAVGWWLLALSLRSSVISDSIWYDQRTTFMAAPLHLANPYVIYFVNPPWTAVLLLPFSWLPLPLAVLIQLCLYFAILAGVVYKYGGDTVVVLLALTSFIAFDSALELNIDWLTCLGLLVPAALSGPFLLVKPQNTLGVWLSFKRHDLVRAIIVSLIVLILSFLIWGDWPLSLANYAVNEMQRNYNMAPLALLPVPIALAIGLALGWYAFKRRDPVWSILAWLFFVPYIKIYSLLLPFTVFAVRQRRIALIITVVMWIVYGAVIARGFLHI